MPAPKKGPRLGGSPAHQKHLVSNLATALFEHGSITTTEARARVLRPVAERLISKAKKGDLHNRREVMKTIHDKAVVHALFVEIAPRFAERPGGYVRITKVGRRKGDNAPMAVIGLVSEPYRPKAPEPRLGDARGGAERPLGSSGPRTFDVPRHSEFRRSGESVSPYLDSGVQNEITWSAEDLVVAEHSSAYDVGKTHGYFQHLRNDEFVHAELQSTGATSLMWSCADECSEFLTAAQAAAPEFFSSGARCLWWRFDDSMHPAGAEDNENFDEYRPISSLLAEEELDSLAFCSFEVEGAVLTWQRPFAKAPWSKLPHGQAALVSLQGSSKDMRRERLLRLLGESGSPVVRMLAHRWPDELREPFDVLT